MQVLKTVSCHPISLSTFLSYRNERVLKRYVKEHGVNDDVAETIFVETLKFLYLCTAFPTPCSPPSKEIDDMWHCFILHTGDYFRFCHNFCGRYLHHDPTETPYIANRAEMRETVVQTFSCIDENLWRRLFNPAQEACDSSCSDNYCSENCSSGPDFRDEDLDEDLCVQDGS